MHLLIILYSRVSLIEKSVAHFLASRAGLLWDAALGSRQCSMRVLLPGSSVTGRFWVVNLPLK